MRSLFGLYLADHLERAGLSQADFAQKVGISRQYLSDIKLGGRPPSGTVLDGMIEHLDLDRDEVYWMAGLITPDIEQLMLDIGPEQWRRLREHYDLKEAKNAWRAS